MSGHRNDPILAHIGSISCRIVSDRVMFSQYGTLEMTYIGTINEPNREVLGHRNDPILAHIGSMSGLIGSDRAMFSQYGMLEITYIGYTNELNRVMSGHRNDPILAHIGGMSGLCRVRSGHVLYIWDARNDLHRVQK